MSHPSERLSLLINTLSLNVNSFANECGYSSSTTIWRIINDNKKPSKPTLDKICARFKNVNKEWLLTGQGSMFNNTTASSDDLTVTAKQVLDKLEPILKEDFEKLANQINQIHEKIYSIEFLNTLDYINNKKKKKKNI
tara:strand:+ start:408 stop:821 length:414 start_codon:yes stop_codon:yes gene_type:complete